MPPNSLRFAVAMALACVLAATAHPRGGEVTRRITGGITSHTASKGETLRSIGARFGVDVATLAADNGLKANETLAEGQELRVDNRHIAPEGIDPGAITINLPQRMLFYEWEGRMAGVPIAVGQADWKTPARPFTILSKETNPTWEVPVSIQEEARRAGRYLPAVVPPGPKNPLGKFWLGLSIPAVGIHGTNAPASIYGVTTHGCIRVGADDIAWLFARVSVGTAGRIIYEPILLAVAGDEIFLEVHRDVYRRLSAHPHDVARGLAHAAGVGDDIDWERAAGVVAARHGVARVVGTRKMPRFEGNFSR